MQRLEFRQGFLSNLLFTVDILEKMWYFTPVNVWIGRFRHQPHFREHAFGESMHVVSRMVALEQLA